MSTTFNKVLVSLVGVATPLGFYRGVQSYHWERSLSVASQQPQQPGQEYLYTVAAGHGLMGSLVYLCPLMVVQNVAKELHRLEVNLRGMENLKHTRYYNELL